MLTPLTTSLPELNISDFPTPDIPLIKAPTTATPASSSIFVVNLIYSESSTHALTQPSEYTPFSLPTFSTPSSPLQPSYLSAPSSHITVLHPYCTSPCRTTSLQTIASSSCPCHSDCSSPVTVTVESQTCLLSTVTDLTWLTYSCPTSLLP